MKILNEEISRIKSMMGLIVEQAEQPICGSDGCSGTYTGPEFDSNGDVAHKYSNTITKSVSEKLKELYQSGNYTKVDMNNIKLSTKGMGTGNVVYKVTIPFQSVSNECDAMTGFAHVGGWGHSPELNKRKSEILSYIPNGKNANVVVDNLLYTSQLTKTNEGLQEYWIQWKHKDFQSKCGKGYQSPNSNPKQQSNNKINIISSDLTTFLSDIKIKTANQQIDLNSIMIDVDKNTMNFVVSNNGKLVKKLVLALSTASDGNKSTDNILSKNPGSSVVKTGKFENGTRIYNLIAII
jgi:hypothetical protein